MATCKQCGSPIEEGKIYCASCEASKSADVNDNRSIAFLSYLGPLCFVPYFAAKRSPFAHYHALCGLNLFILEGVYTVVRLILKALFNKIPVLGTIVGLLLWLGYGFFVYLSVMGIRHVAKGKKKSLPYIGTFRIVKN